MDNEGRRSAVAVTIGERRGFTVLVRELPRQYVGLHLRRFVECLCDCGRTTVKQLDFWRLKGSHSCGCKRGFLVREAQKTHGMGNAFVYVCWRSMIRRCTDSKVNNYHRYGGRGITVCDRWRKFENFYADMGDRPVGMQLERIDNERGYEPSNCTWATPTSQANNRRTNRLITTMGRTQTLAQWVREIGVNRHTVRSRLRRGWNIERAITEELHR